MALAQAATTLLGGQVSPLEQAGQIHRITAEGDYPSPGGFQLLHPVMHLGGVVAEGREIFHQD